MKYWMPGKLQVLLDLDQTLICSLTMQELKRVPKEFQDKFRWHDMDRHYKVFERPYLQHFLDYLFENFDVSVFTAADREYGLFIIENVILTKPDRHLRNYFHHAQTEQSYAEFDSPKDLRLLWDVYKIPGMKPCNTVILDDNPDVWRGNPAANVIRCPPFNMLVNSEPNPGAPSDAFLLYAIHIYENKKRTMACQ